MRFIKIVVPVFLVLSVFFCSVPLGGADESDLVPLNPFYYSEYIYTDDGQGYVLYVGRSNVVPPILPNLALAFSRNPIYTLSCKFTDDTVDSPTTSYSSFGWPNGYAFSGSFFVRTKSTVDNFPFDLSSLDLSLILSSASNFRDSGASSFDLSLSESGAYKGLIAPTDFISDGLSGGFYWWTIVFSFAFYIPENDRDYSGYPFLCFNASFENTDALNSWAYSVFTFNSASAVYDPTGGHIDSEIDNINNSLDNIQNRINNPILPSGSSDVSAYHDKEQQLLDSQQSHLTGAGDLISGFDLTFFRDGLGFVAGIFGLFDVSGNWIHALLIVSLTLGLIALLLNLAPSLVSSSDSAARRKQNSKGKGGG